MTDFYTNNTAYLITAASVQRHRAFRDDYMNKLARNVCTCWHAAISDNESIILHFSGTRPNYYVAELNVGIKRHVL